MPSTNPRYASWKRRDDTRRWVLANFDTCALCGKPVDKTLGKVMGDDGRWHWHPMAPEVDEIVPISRGGSPYDRDNVRLTHRICNQKRGNRMPRDMKPMNLPLPTSREW